MRIEINQNKVEDKQPFRGIMITPPIDESYWIMRVPLSEIQAVVCFPKFGTYGIGFQEEEDWNCNLPFQCGVDEIFNHIAHNKWDETIADEDVKQAIRMLRSALQEYTGWGIDGD